MYQFSVFCNITVGHLFVKHVLRYFKDKQLYLLPVMFQWSMVLFLCKEAPDQCVERCIGILYASFFAPI